MRNTYLKLNNLYRIVPVDRGYRYEEAEKTDNALAPDDVVFFFLQSKGYAEINYGDFKAMHSAYEMESGRFVGIPVPDTEGYSIDIEFADGEPRFFRLCTSKTD
jgi:hypothetical protein